MENLTTSNVATLEYVVAPVSPPEHVAQPSDADPNTRAIGGTALPGLNGAIKKILEGEGATPFQSA